MSMFPWHSDTPGARVGSASSYPQVQVQVPGLRWLPSVLSRSQNQNQNHNQNQNQSQSQSQSPNQNQNEIQHHSYSQQRLPVLRLPTATRHDQPQPGSAGIQSQTQDSPPDGSDESDQSDNRSTGRDPAIDDAPTDPDYAPTPQEVAEPQSQTRAENRLQNGTATPVAAIAGAATNGIAASSSSHLALIRTSDDDLDGEGGLRKHGKRLTTKEEVSLFQICNRHAETFGHRSNLCKWWRTVTDEFTRDQGHPYSWHSVRRKVELVTKQRMKFLEERRDKGGEDFSNAQWRQAVDAWVPTWQRWEEAEARRIERRDSRKTKSRKRKEHPWDPWDLSTTRDDGWRHPSPATAESIPQSQSQSQPQSQPPAGFSGFTSRPATTVRLPPGYGSMFQNQPMPQTPAMRTTAYSPPVAVSGTPTADSSVMSAVLETLTRINKHLDSRPDARSSPVISAFVSNAESETPPPAPPPPPPSQRLNENNRTDAGNATNADNNNPETILQATEMQKLKEELHQEIYAELHRELDKDRAALEEKLDSVQRTQEMILEMLRQEPA